MDHWANLGLQLCLWVNIHMVICNRWRLQTTVNTFMLLWTRILRSHKITWHSHYSLRCYKQNNKNINLYKYIYLNLYKYKAIGHLIEWLSIHSQLNLEPALVCKGVAIELGAHTVRQCLACHFNTDATQMAPAPVL